MKTENLVILFTDIAGFTEASSLHSREQNQRILDRHNGLLLPIVKRFRGRHIKSIGDALLLVFTSPTDGMRCAMAMQDALHEYNTSAPKGEDIHIRIAASLGEVRVTKGDIFGEPVNVTSRIEGITPGDEIYFSEAVYLAMNKAEVPAVEIGMTDLKGISKPVRIFAIPRFAETRLVADTSGAGATDSRVGYPFGGMHLSGSAVANQWPVDTEKIKAHLVFRSKPFIAVSVAMLVIITFVAGWMVVGGGRLSPSNPVLAGSASSPVGSEKSADASGGNGTPTDSANGASEVNKPNSGFMNVAQATAAYNASRISRERYREIVRRLESEYETQIRRAELDYSRGRLSRDAYRARSASLKKRYFGED